MASSPQLQSTTLSTQPRGRPSSTHKGCPHIGSHSKSIIDRLKILIPYAKVCKHRLSLLQGRRGGITLASTVGSGAHSSSFIREATPATTAEGDRSRKRLLEELPPPVCHECHTPVDRLHACLVCEYFGCWRRHSCHILQHMRESNHGFAVDFSHLQVYCLECKDYVYDSNVGSVLMAAQIRWYAALCDSAESEAKRPRIVQTGLELSGPQNKYIREHGKLSHERGIRGLYNLGATCYLSVILQALVHNPLVRGWMLSDGHHPSRCRIGRAEWLREGQRLRQDKEKGEDEDEDEDEDRSMADELFGNSDESLGAGQTEGTCMACELESSFQALFSNEQNSPHGPVKLLRALWQLGGGMGLAGYGQHDAQECLIAILNTMHVGFTQNALTPLEMANGCLPAAIPPPPLEHSFAAPCPCLVHQTFAGVLQSTVTCKGCGNATNFNELFLDISLNIPVPPASVAAVRQADHSVQQPVSTTYRMGTRHSFGARALDASLNEWSEARHQRDGGGFVKSSMTRGNHPVITLDDCLEYYTRAETLASGTRNCSKCKGPTASIKQLLIKELPPVLSFHLKRFGYNGEAKQTASGPSGGHHLLHHKQNATKVDTFVRLPLHIDMTPYTAQAAAAHAQALAGLKASDGFACSNTNTRLPAQVGGIDVRDVGAPGTNSDAAAANLSKDTQIPILDGPGGSTTLGKRRTDATHSNPACHYSLFAVIEHIGQMHTGHYIAYARQDGQWYMFDDTTVTKVAIKDVLGFTEEAKTKSGRSSKGKAYMAFYVKSVLDYNDGPTSAGSEWVEDMGVVVKHKNEKVEKRGRKKKKAEAASRQETEEFMAAGTLNPMLLTNQQKDGDGSESEEDSDGEALWARISKEKALDGLQMLPPIPASQIAAMDPQLFVNPLDLNSSPATKTISNSAYMDEEEENEEDEDSSDIS